MKKLLFTAYSLDVGGIETALVNLLNNLINTYEITLVLEKTQGLFLDDLNPKIKIVEYNPNKNKFSLLRKLINLFKRFKFIIKYKNKFDFAASFATYSKMGSFCARTASKNNALWIHSDYLAFYNNDKEKIVDFFTFINYSDFNNYIFVSENSMKSFISIFPEIKSKVLIVHNLIDYKKILNKANESISLKKDTIITFLNVARHDEPSKKITRLLNVAEKLKNDNLKFRILLIGSGPNTESYKKIVTEKNLSNNVIFLGTQSNPYPYFKISNAIILTSEYEGYPVIFDEARVLNLPIITTCVSDSKKDIENKFGLVCEKNVDDIYLKVKGFVKEGFNIEKPFDSETFNIENLNKLKNLFNGGNNAKN